MVKCNKKPILGRLQEISVVELNEELQYDKI